MLVYFPLHTLYKFEEFGSVFGNKVQLNVISLLNRDNCGLLENAFLFVRK
jgi:hypothetical protein